jgi:hypothetical protein
MPARATTATSFSSTEIETTTVAFTDDIGAASDSEDGMDIDTKKNTQYGSIFSHFLVREYSYHTRPQVGDAKCLCGKKNFNVECTHYKCGPCCSLINTWCKLTAHRRTKEANGLTVQPRPQKPYSSSRNRPALIAGSHSFAILPGLIEQIDAAIRTNTSLYVAYCSGSKPGTHARKITPVSWEKPNVMINVQCHNTNPPILKKFYLSNITRYGTTNWDLPSVAPSPSSPLPVLASPLQGILPSN